MFARIRATLAREAPAWGITPVPGDLRRLSTLDLAVLWGDLAVGLLVLAAGALLVPALGLPQALLAIVVGSAIGCVPLALVGMAGARERVPGMVLFRPVLGLRGSWVPTALNIVQLVGWTALELWAMARVANGVTIRAVGVDVFPLWLVVIALLCAALAIGGPVVVVRTWLERFGVYLVGAVGLWLSYRLFVTGDLASLWSKPGGGGWPTFALAVDLVIAMPVSWLPLVADFNRFAREDASSFAGTYAGFFLGNSWFFALGAMLVLVANAAPDAQGIGESIATLAGGTVLLLVLLVVETDEAFANIYSSAVSAQNLFPRMRQRTLIVLVTFVGAVLAAFLSMDAYQYFLLLIGSVFVPLFGVFLADYFLLGNRGYAETDLFDRGGRYWFRNGLRWTTLVPWLVGFVVYQWSVPTGPGWWVSAVEEAAGSVGLPAPLFEAPLGASVPAFATALALTWVLGLSGRRTRGRGRSRPAPPQDPSMRS